MLSAGWQSQTTRLRHWPTRLRPTTHIAAAPGRADAAGTDFNDTRKRHLSCPGLGAAIGGPPDDQVSEPSVVVTSPYSRPSLALTGSVRYRRHSISPADEPEWKQLELRLGGAKSAARPGADGGASGDGAELLAESVSLQYTVEFLTERLAWVLEGRSHPQAVFPSRAAAYPVVHRVLPHTAAADPQVPRGGALHRGAADGPQVPRELLGG